MDAIINNLSSTPVTFNALQKSSGLSATALALGLVGLAGRVATQGGGFVLAPEPVVTPKVVGPRGPTARVAPRLAACKALMVQMAEGGTTAKALLEASNGQFVYTDILLVAKELLASGAIQESRKGRKATWVTGQVG